MKYFNILLMVFVVLVACKQGEKSIQPQSETLIKVDFEEFGVKIDAAGAWDSAFMYEKYQKIENTDSISVMFSAKVTDVCKSKGCWMKLQVGEGEEAMVRFKDYGFFVPKDIVGREVVVNGLAFVEEMSVEDQRHFAEDGGRPKEEIDKINEPKKIYSFVANGVLLKKIR